MPGRRPPSRPIGGPADAAGGPAAAQRRRHDAGYIVRASELGSYAYCQRAWWLRYVAGLEPTEAGQARLAGGHRRHAAHGQGVQRAAWLWRLGLLCAGLAAVVVLLWLLIALLAH